MNMFKRGKKAISPLIATVLLIAFAVSIGTLIMNIGKDVLANVGDCTDVKIDVQTINGKPLFCYDAENSKVNLMVKNTGAVDIKYLKLGITTADFNHEELSLEDSSLKAGKTLTKSVDYSREGNFKTEIIPVITAAGKETVCLDNTVVTETITSCN
jgi:flagellin-like protein